MKESNSLQAHNKYENLSSQLSAQGVTIEDELKALILMSSLPLSWETYITIVCNASGTVVSHSEFKRSIVTEDGRRRSLIHDSTKDAFVVQSSVD